MHLNVYTYHGPYILDYELGYENAQHRCPVLVTRTSQERYLRDRGVEAYSIGSLFANYRNYKRIEKSENSRGTLAFPSHSTELIDVVLDWDDYADALLALPDEFQPVGVCMYWKDMVKGAYRHFIDKGINVYCAGHYSDLDFVDNFYSIIRNFKYTTGNMVGSHAYYAVEMGIPYFLYGPSPCYNNFGGDPARKSGTYSIKDLEYGSIEHYFCRFPDEEVKLHNRTIEYTCEILGIGQQTPRSVVRNAILRSGLRYAAAASINCTTDILKRVYRKLSRL